MATATPSITELERATVAILRKAREDGGLNELTVRKVRQKLEEQFSLQQGTLEATEYKTVIKEIVVSNLQSESQEPESVLKQPSTKQAKNPNSNRKALSNANKKLGRKEEKKEGNSPTRRKRKSTAVVEEESALEEEQKPRKIALSPFKVKKPQEISKVPKPRSDSKPETSKFKSKAVVESSDDEDKDKPQKKPASRSHSPKKGDTAVKTGPTKTNTTSPANVTAKIDSYMASDDNQEPVASSSKLDAPNKPHMSSKKALKDDETSELSSVIDEPPRKRQKKQGKVSEPKRAKKAKESLSKDEETVNRLKTIVIACGVRKTWKKEFQGFEKPKQQIEHLHKILAELGMKPRYSLEKARAIKEKREFEQELRDIREFEQAVNKRDCNKRASMNEPDSDEPSDSNNIPPKRRMTAKASIQAFLEDQSDDD